ncbi:MAG TPA: permease, partial [Acidimicrobiales bacterium]
MTSLVTMTPWWLDVARSLREAFFMFWETLWPLVLGFGLSGVVQAFVRRDTIERQLGDHRPRTLARATGYGVISSSCSYAATAMSKSLFRKGADFLASLVFMFASTNLVLELGLVLVILMGWQFAASEFVGGILMIVLLAVLARLWLRARVVDQARAHLLESEGAHSNGIVSRHDDANVDDHAVHASTTSPPAKQPWRTKSGWADAATYTMADLTMLRRELVVGYLVAGGLATLVPTRAWNVFFLHGHGLWTTLENVVVGPFIAIISFVCSIGNVPLAAALWHGGIAFGGVVSFIFADLITFPLLLIYRRYYGTRVTLRLLGVFWLVMSVAGLATEVIFRGLGLVPKTRPEVVAPTHFSWNYTTDLNILALAVLALLIFAWRHQRAWGGGAGYA